MVEAPATAVRLLRVAGRLDRPAATRVLRLVDVQLQHISTHRYTAGRGDVAALVIDLGAVSSFEPGGLETLRHAPYSAARRGIGVHLCGCGGRIGLLPLRARQLFAEFSTFPTAELAVDTLTSTDTGTSTGTGSRAAGAGRGRGGAAGDAVVVPVPRQPGCGVGQLPAARGR